MKRKILLEPDSEKGIKAVFNPTVSKKDGCTHIFYRITDEEGRSSLAHAKMVNREIKERDVIVLAPKEEYD
ncbi:MAG TPA: hypothetical protein ENG42_02080, partial [Candidatus Aenigmarchaeota archaeon]|nr:hypothetical protein [Candidatus Aenigmarchaeota archaeon]